MAKLKVLDLFSGIGGFSLGLERTGGFETKAFCEIEPFQREVLEKHWPGVRCYHDVRELTAETLERDGIAVNVLTGGFPCQDISSAGKQAGIGDGTRSGLYSHVIRLTSDLRPDFVILENVANLLAGPSEQPGQWFGTILRDLARLGYDAEWENIPAAAVGLAHRRERIWIVAYPSEKRPVPGLEGILQSATARKFGRGPRNPWIFGVDNPPVCGVDDGIRPRLDGHFALGNSVVPQIPELIGRAILESDRQAA